MQKEHVRVLLATTPQTPVREIEEQLEQTIGLDCRLFQCTDLDACLDRLHKSTLRFDIILLDLTLVSSQESENFLRKIQESAPGIPVIVFTREEDRELALFMVGEGASIVSNHPTFKLEINRLRDVIEYSWIQHKNLKIRTADHTAAIEAERDKSVKDLKEEKEASAERMKEKDQVISWMSGGYSVEHSSKDKNS